MLDNTQLGANVAAVITLDDLVSTGADFAISGATLNIIDDESQQPGIISFLGLDGLTPDRTDSGILLFAVPEDINVLTVLVGRNQGGLGSVGVDYTDETAQGPNSATTGDDYQINSGTLNWLEGDMGIRTFELTIIDDNQQEDDELFFLNLSNPSGNATLGSATAIAISIIDNDAPRCERNYHAGLSTIGSTTACFSSRLNNQPADRSNIVRQHQQHRLSIRIKPDDQHLNEPAEMLLVAFWQPFALGPTLSFARNGDQWETWDGHIPTLPVAESIAALPDEVELLAWSGRLTGLIGNLTIFAGYRRTDSQIVHNSNRPFSLTVLP